MSYGRGSGRDIFGKKKTPPNKIIVCVENTKYPAVTTAAKSLGWAVTYSNEEWDIYWTDSGHKIDRYVKPAKSYQRVNHFPGMIEIYRKNNLARALLKMRELNEVSYDFFPRSWTLPLEYKELVRYMHSKQLDEPECVIVKPSAGAQGKGIYLTFSPHEINPHHDAIVQTYIQRPLLIDGLKFDLRIYALVVCCNPLRVLIYREGLVRLCTAQYQEPNPKNVECSYMHLTNYSVNKSNENFVQNNSDCEDASSKRSLKWLRQWLDNNGHDSDEVWSDICDVVVKTLISIQPSLAEAYEDCKIDRENQNPFTCFEILGFDVMLTDDAKVVLIEVNHTPSFRTDSAFDARVKLGLIQNTFKLLNMNVSNRQRHHSRASALSQVRLYGDTFAANASGSRAPIKLDTDEQKWEKYLANERLNLGDFDVAYPTDCYEGQPTAQFRLEYEVLLLQSRQAYDEFRTARRGLLYGSGVGSYLFAGLDDLDDAEKQATGLTVKKKGSNSSLKANPASGSSLASYVSGDNSVSTANSDSAGASKHSFGSMEANVSSSSIFDSSPSKGSLQSRSYDRKLACANLEGLAEESMQKQPRHPNSKSEPCVPDLNYMKSMNMSMSPTGKHSLFKEDDGHADHEIHSSDSKLSITSIGSKSSVASRLLEGVDMDMPTDAPPSLQTSEKQNDKSCTDGYLLHSPSLTPTDMIGSSTSSILSTSQTVVPQYNRLPNSLRSIQSQEKDMQSLSAKSSKSSVLGSKSNLSCDLPSVGSREWGDTGHDKQFVGHVGYQSGHLDALPSFSSSHKSVSIHTMLEHQIGQETGHEAPTGSAGIHHVQSFPTQAPRASREKDRKARQIRAMRADVGSQPTWLPHLQSEVSPSALEARHNVAHAILLSTESPEYKDGIREEVSKLFPGSYHNATSMKREKPVSPGIIDLSKVTSVTEVPTIHTLGESQKVGGDYGESWAEYVSRPMTPQSPRAASVCLPVNETATPCSPHSPQSPRAASSNSPLHEPAPPTSKRPTKSFSRTQLHLTSNPNSSSELNSEETVNAYAYPRRGRTYSETSNRSASVSSASSSLGLAEPHIASDAGKIIRRQSTQDSLGEEEEPPSMSLGVPNIMARPPPSEVMPSSLPPPLGSPQAMVSPKMSEVNTEYASGMHTDSQDRTIPPPIASPFTSTNLDAYSMPLPTPSGNAGSLSMRQSSNASSCQGDTQVCMSAHDGERRAKPLKKSKSKNNSKLNGNVSTNRSPRMVHVEPRGSLVPEPWPEMPSSVPSMYTCTDASVPSVYTCTDASVPSVYTGTDAGKDDETRPSALSCLLEVDTDKSDIHSGTFSMSPDVRDDHSEGRYTFSPTPPSIPTNPHSNESLNSVDTHGCFTDLSV